MRPLTSPSRHARSETSSEDDGDDSDDSDGGVPAPKRRAARGGAKAQRGPAERFAAFALPDTTGMDADTAEAAVVAARMEAQERARPRRAAAAAAVRSFKDDTGSESAGDDDDDDDEDEEDGDAEDQDGDFGTEQQGKAYADGEADDYAAVRQPNAT